MASTSNKPIIGISMGDPAGIGPEIIAAALAKPKVRELCRPLVVGDASVMHQAIGIARVPLRVRSVGSIHEASFASDVIDVFDLKNIDLQQLRLGQVSKMAGNAAFEAVRNMIELATAGSIAATVTAPIHKEALVLAGHHFPGHTEIFAHFTGTSDFTMMLAAGNFRVVHVSTHVSLRQACDAVKRDRVLKVIGLANDACRRLGIAKPKIGVAGLNPHASDGGLFGSEEREEIIPAIESARANGIDVEGPQPPDTFFAKAVSGAYDVCVAMYHDQGHIPVKITGFKYDATARTWTSVNGINVSLGLPIIRTSVDHGTAFDQAGKGTASDASLLDAIEYAAKLAANR
ncbi:MAG TPA: 4-hydroxythreonine-4-phosphate dehydrogenase PdxA [Tepidisphaeraceae bacterium]|jgi:4-hydroxythreonine-4-phosphate dehydrogenase|nr:4-hydroxythreonine-4-phosphate dehydrogenase PdxA [Tepidisphaeraceae bacterium]